jgi:3-oxoacyl-[acyl-carrier protein] reductase
MTEGNYLLPMTPSTTALITGATHGIGRATAFALGRAGYRVGVCSRTESKIAALVVEQVSAALGEIGVLVNNAGILIARPIGELTLEDWDVTMATNLRSLYLMTRAVLPPMRAKGRGDIVNVASLAARNGFVGGTAYTASKHAVLGFARSLMLELRKEGIRVITICPGSVDTGMLRDQPMLKSDPERILRPDDVAESILHTLRLPLRALVSEVDLRPTNP